MIPVHEDSRSTHGMVADRTSKMAVNIRPLADRVVLRPMDETEQQRGGLLIPAMAGEKSTQGEVVAVGLGRYEKGVRVPMELFVGQMVQYERYAGSEVTVDNEQYIIIEESEVLTIVSE
jgi:chaperonin GroES